MIHLFINEVDSAASKLDTELRCVTLPMSPWKTGQNRRMNIYDAHWKRIQKGRSKHPHETGESDGVHTMTVENVHHGGVKSFTAVEIPVEKPHGRNPLRTCALQSIRLGIVGEHHANLRVDTASIHVLENRLKVRTGTRSKHSKFHRHKGRLPYSSYSVSVCMRIPDHFELNACTMDLTSAGMV